MAIIGTGKYRYELIENWARLPAGQAFGNVSAVATDSQDRVYVFQRKDPQVLVFEREGAYLGGWGIGAFANPHGIHIAKDVVYLTDRDDSVCLTYTLDGKPLQVFGTRGQHSDTRNVTNWLADFSRGYPTPKGAKLPEVLISAQVGLNQRRAQSLTGSRQFVAVAHSVAPAMRMSNVGSLIA